MTETSRVSVRMPGRCNSGNCVQGLFARLKSAARSAARFCRKGTRVPWGSAAPTISSAPRTSTAQRSARPNPWATVAPKLLRPLMRRPTHHRTLARAAVAMLRPTSALTKERSGESLGRTPRQGPAPHGHGIDRTFGAHPAKPADVFAAWLDSVAHGAMTGRGRAKIDPRVGGAHTAWNGYIQGETLELEPGRRIVQSWRTSEFPRHASRSRSSRRATARASCSRIPRFRKVRARSTRRGGWITTSSP